MVRSYCAGALWRPTQCRPPHLFQAMTVARLNGVVQRIFRLGGRRVRVAAPERT